VHVSPSTTLLRRQPVTHHNPSPGLGSSLSGLRPSNDRRANAFRRVVTRSRGFSLAICVMSVLTAAIGGVSIGHESLWLNEAYSVELARAPNDYFWREVLGREASGFEYYLLLRGWVFVVGDSEGAVRSLSLLFAVITVPVFASVVKRMFDSATALVAAALLLINPFFLGYAQEARPYMLAVLLTTVATHGFVHAIERPASDLAWLLYGLIATFAIYAHLYVGFVIAAHLIWFITFRDDRPLRPVLYSACLISASITPLALSIVMWPERRRWIPEPTPVSVATALKELVASNAEFEDPLGWVLLTTVLTLATVALVMASRALRTSGSKGSFEHNWGRAVVLVGLMAVLPIGGSVAISAVHPILVARYLIVALPALLMLVTAGVIRLSASRRFLCALVLAGFLPVASVLQWMTNSAKEDWRTATSIVVSSAAKSDAVLLQPEYTYTAYAYYARRQAGIIPTHLHLEPDPSTSVSSAVVHHPRVWVFKRRGTDSDEARAAAVVAALDRFYSCVWSEDFDGVSVMKFVRRSA
jgi:mannosyltransferase